MDGTTYVEYLRIVLICLLWYICSSSDNIIGKIVLSDFPYPMTLTMVQLLTTSFFLAPFLPCVGATKKGTYQRRYLYTMIMPLAFGKFLSSVSSYISIWKVSVSYAHTVKATLPMFTVILAKLILGEGQTLPVYLSLIPIITGVGIATMTEASFDKVGLTSALTATFCFSLLTIFTKKCLKDTGYHHLQLLILISRIATACFLPFWALLDLPGILHNTEFLQSGRIMQTIVLLLFDGLFNMMHSVFAFTVLALVTPLSYAVANATKRIVIIGGSIIILQNTVSPLNALGMLIAVVGVLTYNKAKYDQVQAARREKVLPYISSETNLVHLATTPNLSHSKSNTGFFTNGQPRGNGFEHGPSALQDFDTNTALNGHLLLQDLASSHYNEGVTLIPVATHTPTDGPRGMSSLASFSPYHSPLSSSPTSSSSSPQAHYQSSPSHRLHSRNVHHV